MTLYKWNELFEHYKRFYNFKVSQSTFKLSEENTEEWLKD